MAAHDHLQGRLFDPKSTRPLDPGEMGPDRWLKQSNVAYHGSFRPDWDSAPYTHFGDKGAAVSRLQNVTPQLTSASMRQTYYSGEDEIDTGEDEDTEPQTHTGRVYARRFSGNPHPTQFADAEANAAHYHTMRKEGYEDWEVPNSIKHSLGSSGIRDSWAYRDAESSPEISGPIGVAAQALETGRPISYRNDVERGDTDNPGVSYVGPRSSHTSWERDVINSPLGHPNMQRVARDRIDRGEEGAVPFEKSWNVPGEAPTPPHYQSSFGKGSKTLRSQPPSVSKVQFQTLTED